ncbi:MAG: histidine kinase, partial [Acidobacteriota bacterium]
GIGSLTWYACLLSSPLYVWLARRFPIYQQRLRRNLAIHFLITTVLVVLTGVIYFELLIRQANNSPARTQNTASSSTPTTAGPNEKVAAPTGQRSAAPGGFRLPDLKSFLLLRFFTESLPFWAMIALIHAFEFHRRYRQREFETARLQTQLAESRLEALTAQLHPHFLFNTLQGISTLMHRNVKAADAMLSRLSDLLRQTLQRGERQEAPLHEEIEMLDHYVEISRERFKNRLVFETQISSEARAALVPFFILQPLVENALQHGIARRAGIGRVCVSAKRQGEMLHLSVTDDGPGLTKEERAFPREGIGLSNTRQRLRQLYGDGQSLTLKTPAEGGLRVELIIPYKIAPVQEPQEVIS